MRRRMVVAASALIAAAALIGLPASAGSTVPSPARVLQATTFVQVPNPAGAPATAAAPDAALRAAGFLGGDGQLVERGTAPAAPTARPSVSQPSVSANQAWKPPLFKLTGWASFYNNGTTAMRLPRGTVVRVCGPGGCLLRTVTDWGPQSASRVIDLYRPDFFAICGCASWSGLTWVTVSVY